MKVSDLPFAYQGRLINAPPRFLSWLLQLEGSSGEVPAELTTPHLLPTLRDQGITPWLYRRVMQGGWQDALDPQTRIAEA